MAKRGRPKSSTSKFLEIADLFRERMRDGVWTNGMVLPSVRDLADEMGVSRHTVWQALNVLKKENAVLASGRGRLMLRFAFTGATTHGGVILQLIGDNLSKRYQGYVRDMQAGIMQGAGRICAPLLVAHDNRLRTEIPDDLLGFPILGIISYLAQRKKLLERLAKLPVPTVLLDHPPVPQKLHSVSVDNAAGVKRCVDELVARGHRKVAFLRYATASMNNIDPDAAARQAAFSSYGREVGWKAVKRSVFTLTTAHTASSAALKQLFDAKPRFTGIISANEHMAHSAIHAAGELGLRVPQDLSVLSFGSVQARDQELSGPRTDFEAMGEMAVRLLKSPKRPPVHQTAPLIWHPGKTLSALAD